MAANVITSASPLRVPVCYSRSTPQGPGSDHTLEDPSGISVAAARPPRREVPLARPDSELAIAIHDRDGDFPPRAVAEIARRRVAEYVLMAEVIDDVGEVPLQTAHLRGEIRRAAGLDRDLRESRT